MLSLPETRSARLRRPKALARALSWLLAVLVAASAQGDESLPSGFDRFVAPVVAGGGSGLAFFPTRYAGGETVAVLDPTGYTVHLTPADHPGEELVFPAGVPVDPPAGPWRVWLQGDWRMTPTAQLMILGPRAREGVSPKLVSVVPAGKVRIAESDSGPDVALWLLAAGWRPSQPFGYALSRRLPMDDGDGIAMPAGLVLPALWDRREERYVALGRPVQVKPGETVSVAFESLTPDAAHLLVFARLPRDVEPEALEGLEPVAVSPAGAERRPDVVVPVREGAFLVWYHVPAGSVRVEDGNGRVYVEPLTTELAGGEVGRLETDLLQRPSLTVHLIVPSRLREKPFHLAVNSLPDGGELAGRELDGATATHRFDGLVQRLVEVVLTTSLGTFRRQTDLTAESEAAITLEPELIEVWGTVSRGGEPQPATVTFESVAGDSVTAETDEDGAYRTVTLQALRWIDVLLHGSEHEPWRDLLAPPIGESRELDVDLSAAEVSVRVIDAATGEGLEGAVVDARIEYLQPPASEDDDRPEERRRRMIGRSFTARSDGIAHLPPLRPGRVELSASADGYRPSAESLVLEIGEATGEIERQIPLQPVGETVALRLSLPGGSPAAGAEVLRVDGAASGNTLFFGAAGADGVVEVPVEPRSGLLLLRHPDAGSSIVDWREVDVAAGPRPWTFPPRSAEPLTVRVLQPSGDEPMGRARVALWVGGRKISAGLARWLFDARPAADPNGYWVAHRLPAMPVRVVAWSLGLEDEAATGALDPLATDVPYPWPVKVEVRVVR